MNTVFMDIIREDMINFIKNADETDCKLVLDKVYQKGFFDYIMSLRNRVSQEKNSSPVSFLSQFPEQSTKLPAVSFILGNCQADLGIQTYSYETGELTEQEYLKFRHLTRSITGDHQEIINTKSYIHTTQLVIGCYANNKVEVSWLLHLVDFLLKFRTEQFALLGYIDLSTSQTDLRLQQELFPLAVPTRILTVNFKYEKVIPRIDPVDRYPSDGIDIRLS